MAVDRSLPLDLRLAVLRRELARSLSSRAPRRALRAFGAVVWPSHWPNPTVRAAVLDAALESSRGPVAADLILSDLATTRRAFIPTAPAARRRAAALTVLAQGRPPVERAAELSI